MTVTLTTEDDEQHSVTIPKHRNVHIGTLNAIVADVAHFLGKSKKEVLEALFG